MIAAAVPVKLAAIALDYDGTIALHGVMDPAVRGAIADARAAGIAVLLVTGRRLVLFVALNVSRGRLRVRNDAPPSRELGSLTKREREVLHFVALGYTGLEIAAELQLAHETVRTHVRNAMGKTGARSRAHLVAKALGEGLTLG